MSTLKNIDDFYVVGISYRNTDTLTRGRFAVQAPQYQALLESAPVYGIEEFFVLSTCNRTEIYGVAPSAGQLASFLTTQTSGSWELFMQKSYILRGQEAIAHLFKVSAGIDSQILGDYEIISQIKLAVKTAKAAQCIGLFLEKMFNSTLQSSRAIRSLTKLSSGSVSVSFAAAQYIAEHFPEQERPRPKIVLLGTGKIGRNTCKNLIDTLHTRDITLVNRTEEKAQELAHSLGLAYAPYTELEQIARDADVILVATNAPQPTLTRKHLAGSRAKIVIDLSVPHNVAADVAESDLCLVNVDELSQVADKTLQMRKLEVPKAEIIINEHIAEFRNWYLMRQHVPVIRAVKHTLEHLKTRHSEFAEAPMQSDDTIQKVLNNMAMQMRSNNQGGCNFILAINDFMTRA